MIVRYTEVDASYFRVNGTDLENGALFNQVVPTFLINPVTIDEVLEGDKDSTFSTAQVDGNLKLMLDNPIVLPNAENYTVEAWNSRGWTTDSNPDLIKEIGLFLFHNLSNSQINPDNNDVNLIVSFGNIGGTDYVIPFAYIGNQGIALQDDVYGDMLFTDLTFEYVYGNALFTDTEFDLTIDGDLW